MNGQDGDSICLVRVVFVFALALCGADALFSPFEVDVDVAQPFWSGGSLCDFRNLVSSMALL